jgi:ribonuclease P protein subunit POP4
MIRPDNLVRHELIGLKLRIVSSSNKTLAGLSGKVIDETRNMLVIEKADGKEISVQKETAVFSFEVGSVWVKVDGKALVGRPEDRIKKKFKKW